MSLLSRRKKRKIEFGMNGFDRRFCVEAHGIYNLAIWAYNRELKEHILIPQVSNFCQDLVFFKKIIIMKQEE